MALYILNLQTSLSYFSTLTPIPFEPLPLQHTKKEKKIKHQCDHQGTQGILHVYSQTVMTVVANMM